MHFEKSLRRSIYAPWREQYIDYPKIKKLLRDEGSDAGSQVRGQDEDDQWTEEDEGKFVEELVNVQLEKVHQFQSQTMEKLQERLSNCERKLDDIAVAEKKLKGKDGEEATEEEQKRPLSNADKSVLKEALGELDGITKEMNELEKFSRINYTGFLKAAKKHDRKRGHAYRVRPLMNVRLNELPFYKEDYDPLLYRIQVMYGFIRQRLELDTGNARKESIISIPDSSSTSDRFTSYKFWVHPENMLELRTVILRRLPVLVYNPQTSKIADGIQPDPTVTSIYFDNPKFSLYSDKIEHVDEARSLRIRWHDQLTETQEVFIEKKTVYEDDTSKEQKLTMKPKYVQSFLKGEYGLQKDIAKLTERFGKDSEQVKELESTVKDIQNFIETEKLQPVLRANYARTAFQIPGDQRVRITIDNNLALIREDALDTERPCREPDEWHRRDIDDTGMEYPFDKIRKGEINRFPYALLEIRIKGNKKYEWVNDLMNSHLVKTAPRFSKFVHGVAQLFEDYVNTFPFWLGEVDQEIRKDPQVAWEEEQERRLKAAEDESAVGSLLTSRASGKFSRKIASPVGSPSVKGYLSRKKSEATQEKATAEMTRRSAASTQAKSTTSQARIEEDDSDDDDAVIAATGTGGVRSFLPSFSRYAQSRRHGEVKLPPGVNEPTYWIKNEGPNKVEAKVWLANQRTFIKWAHVAILLSSLGMGLYYAARGVNRIAESVAIVFTLLGLFTSWWGYSIYLRRSRMIQERSGKDFDNIVGPVVVCTGLIVALCLNLGFRWQAVLEKSKRHHHSGSTVAAGNDSNWLAWGDL